MPRPSLDRLLEELEQSKTVFGRGEDARVSALLAKLSRQPFADVEALIHFHEALLFLRAFPQGPRVLARSEGLLETFGERIQALKTSGADLSDIDTFEYSGIVGTTMEDTLTFDVVRWLVRRIPGDVEIAWDKYEDERAMGEIWPRFLPLLEEDAYVEADTPWQKWLDHATRAVRGRISFSASNQRRQLPWLIERFERLPGTGPEKAQLYDALRFPIRWQVRNFRFSRTGNWRRVRPVHFHTAPLIQRKQVSIEHELAKPAPPMQKLSLQQGQAVVDRIREVMAVRYRELYGTTLADPASVVRAEAGRGVVIYLWGLAPDRRLPLRAYVAGFTVKNGVPINYIEAIGLCDWIEVGFNTFYTFRNGETAWIYAQVLRCLRRHMGAKCVSVYPYQIGQDNDEAIESGAFWFYRKLGFRPGRKDLLKLAEREEQRIALNPNYKTPARTLKHLAEGHIFYDMKGAEPKAWDRFSTRKVGLALNRRMAQEFGGDSGRMRSQSAVAVEASLGTSTSRWSKGEQKAFQDWALVLAMIPSLRDWTSQEKRDLVAIVRAKAGRNEMNYLRLTQKHKRLRLELLRLGSSSG